MVAFTLAHMLECLQIFGEMSTPQTGTSSAFLSQGFTASYERNLQHMKCLQDSSMFNTVRSRLFNTRA